MRVSGAPKSVTPRAIRDRAAPCPDVKRTEGSQPTLSRKPCRLKGATDKRGIGLIMGCRGKAFGDCAKFIMEWFKGVVFICISVECLEEKPKGGKRSGQGGSGRNKYGKIERKVDKSS